MHEKNYWATTAPQLPVEVSTWPTQVEVAVIGGGFTGLSAGRALANHGARVAVLDAESLGWGASSRNAGMTLHGLKLGASSLIQNYGPGLARRLFGASVAAVNAVEAIVRAEQIECDFARTGHLELAFKPAHYGDLEHEAEVLERDFQHSVKLIARASLSTEIDSELYHGGLLDRGSAGLNPAKYVQGLAQAALKAGAILLPQTRVQTLEREPGGFRLLTTRGPLSAQNVVIATSGYTSRVTPKLQKRVIPIGSYIIATEPLPNNVAMTLIPQRRMLYDTKNFLYYFRLTPDNRLLFGGRAGFFPETPLTVRESAAILREAMLTVYPQLSSVKTAYAWGGTLDFAFDMMPHAGQLDGLCFALGYAGTGVALATYLGALVADQLAGVERDNPFAEIPFAGLPAYSGTPWFLPLAEAWFRWLDWVS